jgi:hypothetical protein
MYSKKWIQATYRIADAALSAPSAGNWNNSEDCSQRVVNNCANNVRWNREDDFGAAVRSALDTCIGQSFANPGDVGQAHKAYDTRLDMLPSQKRENTITGKSAGVSRGFDCEHDKFTKNAFAFFVKKSVVAI